MVARVENRSDCREQSAIGGICTKILSARRGRWIAGSSPAMTACSHDRLPHPSPDPHPFPQLSRREPSDAGGRGGAGRAERRRKDQLHRGDLVSVAGTRACAARRSRMSPTIRATARGRCPPRSRARWGSQRSAPASMRRAARRRHQPALPDRPRTGQLGHRVRRSFAHGVADARDGRAVPGRGIGAAAVLRPAGAGDRQRAFEPGLGAGSKLALAQPAAGSAQLRRPLVRRDRTRNRRTRGRGGGDTRPDRDKTRRDAARARRGIRPFRRRTSCSTAGWKTRCSPSPPPR